MSVCASVLHVRLDIFVQLLCASACLYTAKSNWTELGMDKLGMDGKAAASYKCIHTSVCVCV